MPALRNYRVFISHSWTYKDQYDRLVELLKEEPYFEWSNHSVPKDDPIHNASNAAQLREAIKKQMQGANCVVILAGVYSTYSKWIKEEINLAKDLEKPIVAVEYWGSERTSQVVKDNADKIVGWNAASVVKAIRDLSI